MKGNAEVGTRNAELSASRGERARGASPLARRRFRRNRAELGGCRSLWKHGVNFQEMEMK